MFYHLNVIVLKLIKLPFRKQSWVLYVLVHVDTLPTQPCTKVLGIYCECVELARV